MPISQRCVHEKSSDLFHVVTRKETFLSSNPACPPAWRIWRDKHDQHYSSFELRFLPQHFCFRPPTFSDQIKHVVDLEADFVCVLADVLIQGTAARTLRSRLRFRSGRRSTADALSPLLPVTIETEEMCCWMLDRVSCTVDSTSKGFAFCSGWSVSVNAPLFLGGTKWGQPLSDTHLCYTTLTSNITFYLFI